MEIKTQLKENEYWIYIHQVNTNSKWLAEDIMNLTVLLLPLLIIMLKISNIHFQRWHCGWNGNRLRLTTMPPFSFQENGLTKTAPSPFSLFLLAHNSCLSYISVGLPSPLILLFAFYDCQPVVKLITLPFYLNKPASAFSFVSRKMIEKNLLIAWLEKWISVFRDT